MNNPKKSELKADFIKRLILQSLLQRYENIQLSGAININQEAATSYNINFASLDRDPHGTPRGFLTRYQGKLIHDDASVAMNFYMGRESKLTIKKLFRKEEIKYHEIFLFQEHFQSVTINGKPRMINTLKMISFVGNNDDFTECNELLLVGRIGTNREKDADENKNEKLPVDLESIFLWEDISYSLLEKYDKEIINLEEMLYMHLEMEKLIKRSAKTNKRKVYPR